MGNGIVTGNNELFPPSPRVIYELAPLTQVTCQLRFPRLLKIEGSPPIEFQERIRDHFPLFEKGGAPTSRQGAQMPPELMQFLNAQFGGGAYRFMTEDRTGTVVLTPDSLAFTTSAYKEWKYFLDQFRGPLKALIELYRPSFFSRVGLRYVDAINRKELSLEECSWSELLRPDILGSFAFPEFEANVEIVTHQIKVKLPDQSGSVLLQHGFTTIPKKEGISYLIDFDFSYEPKTEVENAESTLNHFNGIAGSAFRWCISDKLHVALKPRTPEENSGERSAAAIAF